MVKRALRRIYYRPHDALAFGGEILRSANWTPARYAPQEFKRTLLPR